ncbi:MAG: homoserine O-succinyltransferase [Candidatus Sulfotelmatobacter sp.]|jgi:homoserine O-succinyltransferase
MPLIIEGPIPSGWAERNPHPASPDSAPRGAGRLSIALINNMPDAAMEDTELQFFDLLGTASDDLPVFLKLYSLTGIPRTDRGQQRLNSFYFGLDDLWNRRFDAVIMTGTEPRQSNLREEPYWTVLANVLEWAESNTFSTILSCLAAHAGVLHSDGISRHPLSDKQFGVFDFAKVSTHPLTNGTGERVRFPHSRWNEVQAEALIACGYTILTESVEGGVDSFVKKKKQSLFLHFQGHPEYGAQTLLKEYRRDIRRFLKKERETYPSVPKGYFESLATKLVNDFRDAALRDRREDRLEKFPEAALVDSLENTWRPSAVSIYRNWLQYVVAKKTDASSIPAMAVVSQSGSRKRSARPE